MRSSRRLPRPVLALAGASLVATVVAGPAASAAGVEPPGRSTSAGADAASNADRGQLHSHGPDGLDLDRGRRTDDPAGAAVVAEPVDEQLTGAWSEADPLTSLTSDQPDRFAGLPSVHLVYLYPSDMKKPRTSFLNMFEADAKAAKSFLESKYGRSVRFDERTDARIDITTVKSAYRTRQLGGSNQFDLVKRDLERVFPDGEPRKKYIAWLDAPSKYCGQGELYGDWHRDRENWNDLRTTGVVYRPYSMTNQDGGFCRGRTLMHELGHNLGALYSGAPNAFDGAHCDDDKNDAMCYQGNSVFDSSQLDPPSTGEFDWGNDDYWDEGAVTGSVNGGPEAEDGSGPHLLHLNWWTVNLSRFVCRPYLDGSGTVAPFDCGHADSVHPTLDEFRYHSGDEAYPPPDNPPTG